MRILVLCAGNIGRSPLAKALLRHHLAVGLGVAEEDLGDYGVTITSAGTDAPEGHPASTRGIAYAASRGLDLTGHVAGRLTPAAVAAAELIYCMDDDQIAAVTKMEKAAATRAQLLAGEGIEIPDPHHQSDAFFAEVAAQIERAIVERTPVLLASLDQSR